MKLGIWNHVPTFLYPKPSEWDCRIKICRTILLELEKRDFIVPEIEVCFSFNGFGMDRYKYVSEIKWNGIYIWFCYRQGFLPGYNYRYYDIAGLGSCTVPSLGEVTFNSDGSGDHVTDTEIESYNNALQPLLEYIEGFVPEHEHVVIFDKVMGNAAALLSIKARCQEVYSPLGSQLAVATLEKHGISYHLAEIIPCIQKPDGREMCPMEELSISKDPEEFYEIMRNRPR